MTMLFIVAVWEGLVAVFNIPIYLLPPPSAVVRELVAQNQMLMGQALATTTAIVLGFIAAILIGIPTATMMVYSTLFNRAVYPVLITAQVLPKVALAPLFIIWFGFGLLPKVVMTFLIAFFPIVIDTLAGLMSVRPESLMLIRSMGGNKWQSFLKVRLPTALPHVFAGLKVAVTFAVVGAIVAEFVASDSGLGFVLVEARGSLNMPMVFATIAWLIAIGFAFFYAVEIAERLLVRNRTHVRGRDMGAGL